MRPQSRTALALSFLPLIACGAGALGKVQSPASDDRFETRIRPLFAEKCSGCHGAGKQAGGLRLDLGKAALSGGANGPIVVPGKPNDSRLIHAVRQEGPLKMPPGGKLSPSEVAELEAWVASGAKWPEPKVAVLSGDAAAKVAKGRSWWAFQPVRQSAPPRVAVAGWVKNPIDQFILAGMSSKGLKPASAASRGTLFRRASFDLLGLPPAKDEMDRFLNDRSPKAWESAVDRLLASTAYGERWGRHWLDLVRYCDSLDSRSVGSEGDISFAYRYRDWVVNALNTDMPYDRFVRYQIAGDALPVDGSNKPPQPDDVNVEGMIASGVLAIGNWGNGDADKDKIIADIVDDQLDLVTRTFMGVTFTCARCHDHKFDPFTQRDYYSMAGIFFSTHILPKLTPKGAGENVLRLPLITKAEREKRSRFELKLADLENRQKSISAAAAATVQQKLAPYATDYLLAAFDYTRTSPTERGDLASFSRKRGLEPFAVRQCSERLGLGGHPLMTVPARNVGGLAGIMGFKRETDTPSLLVNTYPDLKGIGTPQLPGRSVTVHPSPTNPVSLSWTSPIAGTAKLSGFVADADPACGNGVTWTLTLNSQGANRTLAEGTVDNAGRAALPGNLQGVDLKLGDALTLAIGPRGDYSCDTTHLDLKIESGGKTWSTNDLLDDLLAGNPHADRYGNAAVWSFREVTLPAPKAPFDALAQEFGKWDGRDRAGLEKRVGELAQKIDPKPDPSSPFYPSQLADASAFPREVQEQLAEIGRELVEHRKTAPGPVEMANVAQEGGIPESPHAGVHDVRIHLRGRYDTLGDLAPRGFPAVMGGEREPAITQGSGRVQLAEWITRPNHPLTSRVIVNRVWQYHFGQGLVRTPSNYGALGEKPTHPELLDWLAARFVEPVGKTPYSCGWSLKRLHRLIMSSAAYQQSSSPNPAAHKLDPDNRLFTRMNRRRLESEPIRDSLLWVADKLDPKVGGPSIRDAMTPRRAIYLMSIRSDRTGFGPLFDAADTTALVDRRVSSIVAPQALFLMNDPFAAAQASAFGQRLEKLAAGNPAKGVREAYQLAFGRQPLAQELAIGLQMVKEGGKAWVEYAQVLLCSNEFVMVD